MRTGTPSKSARASGGLRWTVWSAKGWISNGIPAEGGVGEGQVLASGGDRRHVPLPGGEHLRVVGRQGVDADGRPVAVTEHEAVGPAADLDHARGGAARPHPFQAVARALPALPQNPCHLLLPTGQRLSLALLTG